MDHAEARERLADLALEPARLASLAADPSLEGPALREHLETCDACRSELAAIRRIEVSLREAFEDAGDDALGRTDAAHAPERVRARLMARLVRRGRPGRRWRLALAAATLIAMVSGAVLVERTADLATAERELAGLASAVSAVDRILAAPDHRTVLLRAADGGPGGTVLWTGREVVIVATGLTRPTDGRVYRCWVEEAGRRTVIGEMWFSGEIGWWAAPTDDWPLPLRAGVRVGISVVPGDGGEPLPLLVADL